MENDKGQRSFAWLRAAAGQSLKRQCQTRRKRARTLRIRQKLHPMPDSQKVRRTAQKTLPEKAMLLLRISHGREIQRP